MIWRIVEWFQRKRLARRLKRGRQEFHEVSDLAEYYDDQVNRINVEIDVRHTELQGLVLVRNTMIHRRDCYRDTGAQLEAQYRQA